MRVQWKTLFKKVTLDSDTFPYGMRFYDGAMGSGKTLSMLNDTFELLKQYDNVFLASNVIINKPNINYYYFQTIPELIKLLEIGQTHKHAIIIIDEALSYFAENGGIDPALMSSITQTRKSRMLIMLATQKFKRLNNRLRDFSLERYSIETFVNNSDIGQFRVKNLVICCLIF